MKLYEVVFPIVSYIKGGPFGVRCKNRITRAFSERPKTASKAAVSGLPFTVSSLKAVYKKSHS